MVEKTCSRVLWMWIADVLYDGYNLFIALHRFLMIGNDMENNRLTICGTEY